MCVRDQCSIFSTGGKFRPDYGLLLELHAPTLVARSYRSCLYYQNFCYGHTASAQGLDADRPRPE